MRFMKLGHIRHCETEVLSLGGETFYLKLPKNSGLKAGDKVEFETKGIFVVAIKKTGGRND